MLDRYKDILMAKGMTEDMVKDITLDDADGVNYYILGRETNIGYVCFESDSDIVNGVAKVFPGILHIGCRARVYDYHEQDG